MIKEPEFSLGVEEEYLLVNIETRDLPSEVSPELLDKCTKALSGRATPEFLQCQIEVGTSVCKTAREARGELAEMRQTITDIAAEFGLQPIASSTHPFGSWGNQNQTHKERYQALLKDLQRVGQRMLICGMHVHVGIEDDDLRIDIFNQLSYFLPHLLALSTSSPYWQGQDTGLNSYRLTVFDNLPRTGLPPNVESLGEYERMVGVLIKTGIIEDVTKIWWDLRPSGRFPTIESRICDLPTRVDDTVAIAATFQCICRLLYRLRRSNQRWRQYSHFLIAENRWRAQRYGMSMGMIDFGKGVIEPFETLGEELISMLMEDAEALNCVEEMQGIRRIMAQGTSADRQRAAYAKAIENGADHQQALIAVVDHLRSETTAKA